MPELIDEGVTGAIIRPGDVVTLADCLTRILSDPALAESMGTQGLAKLKREFVWSVTSDRISQSLQQALHGTTR